MLVDIGAANTAKAITPSDTVEQPIWRGIYVGSGGDIKITDYSGNATVFVAVPQGVILPIQAKLVWATGTTASSLVYMT